MTYATLAQFKARMNRTDDRDDTTMTAILAAASRHVDGLTNRVFTQAAGTRTFAAELTTMCEIDDAVTITAIATDLDGNGTYETAWVATDYSLVPNNASALGVPYTRVNVRPMGRWLFPVFRASNTVPPNQHGVQITATWGWPSVPEEITEATLLLAIRLFKRIDAPFGIAGNADLGQMTMIPRTDPDVTALVGPFVRPKLTL